MRIPTAGSLTVPGKAELSLIPVPVELHQNKNWSVFVAPFSYGIPDVNICASFCSEGERDLE